MLQEQLIADLLQDLSIVKGQLALAENENVCDCAMWLRVRLRVSVRAFAGQNVL